jgi:hypothetical protein
MVVHITDYSFGEAGASKAHHQVQFSPSLRILPQWCTEDCAGRKHSQYRLVATVVHHGRHASGVLRHGGGDA